MRKVLIAGNWKMHKTTAEAEALATAIRDSITASSVPAEVVVAPPFTALDRVSRVVKGSPVALAGQTMHAEDKGAFTGEISPAMLLDLGCTHVILGHSERRQLFGETDEGVMKKARVAIDRGLVPILCIGETLDEREAGRTFDVVGRQLEAALRRLTPDEAAGAVIAYEPVWAIGTGKNATPADAQEVHAAIRAALDPSLRERTRILYGGSVKPDNAAALLAQPDVDGALVGGASLDAAGFGAILRAAAS